MTEAGSEQRVAFDDGTAATVEAWGEGPAILCIHGIASSRKSWERFGRHFATRFRTYAYDQRGHGDAAATHGPMTHARSVADARAVAAALDRPIVALVGHSWGGAVALLAALEIAQVRSVVAVDPMIRVEPRSWATEYSDDVAADLALDPPERERVLRERLAGWGEPDIAGKFHALRSMSALPVERLGTENRVDEGGWDLRERIRAYPKPLLVAAAEPADSVMNADDLALLRDAQPNVTLVTFSGQGHNLHRTAFGAFAEAVDRFLSGLN